MDNLELLKSLGAEIINSAPECQSVTRWSGVVATIVIMFGTFFGTLVFLYKRAGYHRAWHVQTALGTMALIAVIASFVTIVNPQAIDKAVVKEEPTGKTLYTVVVSDQTDMVGLQRNFDIIEDVTLNTITVRDKDEPAAIVDPAPPVITPAAKE